MFDSLYCQVQHISSEYQVQRGQFWKRISQWNMHVKQFVILDLQCNIPGTIMECQLMTRTTSSMLDFIKFLKISLKHYTLASFLNGT